MLMICNDRSRELSHELFSRRAFILLIGKFIIAFVIIVRLFTLQILKGKNYNTLSEKNRIKLIPLLPRRGTIKDLNGNPLAQDILTHRAYFYKQKGKPVESTLKQALEMLDLPTNKTNVLFKTVQRAPYLQPILLKDNISWDSLTKIESNLYNLPGVYIENSFVRHYPLKENLAHVLGYMGLPSTDEVDLYKLHSNVDTKIGKTGIEKLLNPSLIGSIGSRKVEVNANRIIVRTLHTDEGIPGKDITISIHSSLQKFVHSKIIDKQACLAVIDVSTGNLLAACSTPSFDPNIFAGNFDDKTWQSVSTNKGAPLINKLIGKSYPPGSTWKIITALAALEAGIDPEEKILCNGHVYVGDRMFHCWKEDGHGYVNFYNSLPQSCNCYFYKMGLRIGIENIFNTADILGMGKKTGFELPGEVNGTNPNKEWKLQILKRPWAYGDTANASIGQGFVLATPLQLLTMVGRVTTGKIIYPSLLKKEDASNYSALPFKEENLKLIQTALTNVFNDPHGTGFGARIKEPEFAMAGKTGTAQVISKNIASELLKDPLRSHSLFVGYAPAHSPKYACVVVAENAGWGSVTAGPIGRDVLLFAQKERIIRT